LTALTPQLWMLRPGLSDLPHITIAQGYALRSYRPGDSRHWESIITQSFAAEPGAYSFDEVMRHDPAFRPERIWFAVRGDEPVATAAAYYWPTVMSDAGNIHYVGALRAHQGKGLGYSVVLAALHQMAREGRRRAWLSTDDFRLAAIKTYLKAGFEPLLIHENQRERWRSVFAALGLPELRERFAAILEGPTWKPPEYPKDDFDYERVLVRRRRWMPDRAAGRPSRGEVDALADESLYRPSALGTAWADVSSVAAGENRPFQLWFRVGRAGIPEGTEVIFHTPGQAPLGTRPQTDDPERPAFVEAHGPERVELAPLCLGFRVERGRLQAGDQVWLTIGKAAGFTWTPLAGRKELKVIVDVGHGEPQMRLPEPVVVRVLPREPDHAEVFLPTTASEGDTLRATVTVRDSFDNRVPYDGPIALGPGAGTREAHLTDGIGRVEVGRLGSEPVRVEASGGPAPGGWQSNWCLPTRDLNLYVGDLHCHDFASPAEGYTADVYRWALEEKRLDFLSVPVQAHAYQDNEKWVIARHMAEAFLDEGRFVTFLAFEWQHSHYGDKVVHYLGGDAPCLPVDIRHYDHPAKLYEALRGTDALVVSHHPAYALDLHVPGTDWDAVETDVERLVEIWSMHGSSEGYDATDRPLAPPWRPEGVMAALRRGLRVGIVAGSDSHSGRPGGSAKEPRAYRGGLCAVWAQKLTRRSLFEALVARRTYALTGARIILRFSVNGAPMGSEIPACDTRRLLAEVWAPRRVASIQLMREGRVLHELSPGEEICRAEFVDSAPQTALASCGRPTR